MAADAETVEMYATTGGFGSLGALVAEVDEHSRAYQEGLRPGTVIQAINDMPIRSAREAVLYSRFIEGPQLVLQVWRRGQTGFIRIEPQ